MASAEHLAICTVQTATDVLCVSTAVTCIMRWTGHARRAPRASRARRTCSAATTAAWPCRSTATSTIRAGTAHTAYPLRMQSAASVRRGATTRTAAAGTRSAILASFARVIRGAQSATFAAMSPSVGGRATRAAASLARPMRRQRNQRRQRRRQVHLRGLCRVGASPRRRGIMSTPRRRRGHSCPRAAALGVPACLAAPFLAFSWPSLLVGAP